MEADDQDTRKTAMATLKPAIGPKHQTHLMGSMTRYYRCMPLPSTGSSRAFSVCFNAPIILIEVFEETGDLWTQWAKAARRYLQDALSVA